MTGMRFEYFEPAPDLRELVSSYYLFSVPFAWTDILRAEIANVRFVLRGRAESHDADGRLMIAAAPGALLCGPSLQARTISFAPDTVAFGASVTPLGWLAFFGVAADECADRFIDLADIAGAPARNAVERLEATGRAEDCVAICDRMFRRLSSQSRPLRHDFLGAASRWLTAQPVGEIDELIAETGISARQTERLCLQYFGASPKRLQRKFRALHASNYLAWSGDRDWRRAAGDSYYDQSHFIKNFREFIGATPQAFVSGQSILVRQTLLKRLSIPHASPFSLIG